jgi:signal transduction histidine kinase
VPDDVILHVLAVAREAVSNAVRHAGARTVTVTLDVESSRDQLLLDIVDDGIGIPPDVARSGLHNLAERAEQLGGTLTVAPRHGGGTRLLWRVPLG